MDGRGDHIELYNRLLFDGCFDLTHYGHSNGLRQTKMLCHTCVANTPNDNVIQKYKAQPVFPESERREIVLAYRWVDEFKVTDVWTYGCKLLQQYNCDKGVHGDDHCPDQNDGSGDAYEELKKAGKFLTISRSQGISASAIFERILLPDENCNPSTLDNEAMFTKRELSYLEQLRSSADGTPGFIAVDKWNEKLAVPTPWLSGSTKPHGARVVYVQATFDLLNAGDVQFLRQSFGENVFLVVGVEKNTTETINTLPERVLNLIGMKHLSRLIIDVPPLCAVTAASLKNHYGINQICVRQLRNDPELNLSKLKNALAENLLLVPISTESHVTSSIIKERIISQKELYLQRLKKHSDK